MSDFISRIHRAMYGKNDDPEHEDNRHSREFLDGYAEGFSDHKGVESIANEWRARGCPEELPAGFCEWKRGFNAGSLRSSWATAKGAR